VSFLFYFASPLYFFSFSNFPLLVPALPKTLWYFLSTLQPLLIRPPACFFFRRSFFCSPFELMPPNILPGIATPKVHLFRHVGLPVCFPPLSMTRNRPFYPWPCVPVRSSYWFPRRRAPFAFFFFTLKEHFSSFCRFGLRFLFLGIVPQCSCARTPLPPTLCRPPSSIPAPPFCLPALRFLHCQCPPPPWTKVFLPILEANIFSLDRPSVDLPSKYCPFFVLIFQSDQVLPFWNFIFWTRVVCLF